MAKILEPRIWAHEVDIETDDAIAMVCALCGFLGGEGVEWDHDHGFVKLRKPWSGVQSVCAHHTREGSTMRVVIAGNKIHAQGVALKLVDALEKFAGRRF